MRILAVEDEPFVRENIAEMLQMEGFEVATAPDGPTGIRLAHEYKPDLIFCDIKMPGMTGFEVVRRLRSDPATQAIPVVMLTALADLSTMRESMDIGADDFLTKPFTRAALLNAIRSRMDRVESLASKAQERVQEFLMDLSATIPHELRTPLAAIIGYSEFLMKYSETMDRPELVEMATAIYNGGNRLHETIEKFILFSRLSMIAATPAQAAELRMRRASTEHAATVFMSKAPWVWERLEDIEMPENSFIAAIDEYHLYRVFDELISNAVKFSEPGDPVCVTVFEEDGMCNISVQNAGREMSDTQIEIIGAFRQFDRDKFEQQGLGLGLVSVKLIADIYCGDLDIRRRPEGGTLVTFRVPMAHQG